MVLVNICNFSAKLLFQSKLHLCKFLSETDEQETNSFFLHIPMFYINLLPMSRFKTPLTGLLIRCSNLSVKLSSKAKKHLSKNKYIKFN